MGNLLLFILFNSFALSLASGTAKLVLYPTDADEPITLTDGQCDSGVIFSESYDFTCACMTGLWAFYEENCQKAKILTGGAEGQCIPIDFKIHKVNRLSPLKERFSRSSATVFDDDFTSMGDKFISEEEETPYFVTPGYPVVVTTGKQAWRLPDHRICLRPPVTSNGSLFCIFNHKIKTEYRLGDAPCIDDEILAPVKCVPYLQTHKINPSVCAGKGKKGRERREAPAQSGRAFLDAINGLQDPNAVRTPVNITDEDENKELNVMIQQPIINSELWNYMTKRAQERLGLRQSSQSVDKTYSAAFSFLNLAKQVQQKNCPDHYVTDAHYDVAIGAFTAIQRNYFRFTDAFVDFASSERIEEALNACLANISTPYPFVEMIGGINDNESDNCNDSKPITHGSYFKYNELLELNVRSDLASRSNEPIVETVWKVFIHAHSACYPFFKDNYNDHHRFTSIMLSLFTNEINDLWFNITELPSDIYSGFLGDAVSLMDSVAYCSLFSRLDSKYPWDLPRPKKYNARRKRHVEQETYEYQCIEDSDARNICRSDYSTLASRSADDDSEIEKVHAPSESINEDGKEEPASFEGFVEPVFSKDYLFNDRIE